MLLEHSLPVGYRFKVFFAFGDPLNFNGDITSALTAGALNIQNFLSGHDMMFQSVSGLSVDIETEEYAEGGENGFKHSIPVRTKYPNLVLTRGLANSSAVSNWVRSAVMNFEFVPANISIFLLNESDVPLHAWNVQNAIPVRWSVDSFNAEESKIVIETMELKYHSFIHLPPELLGLTKDFI